MRQAFAPYTGTALSQPALWAGGLIPRRMYVQPFSAVNNLERLLQLGQYRRYISVDEILSVILSDWSNVVRLDSQLAHPERLDEMYKFDLCSTLTELTGRLDQDGRRARLSFSIRSRRVCTSECCRATGILATRAFAVARAFSSSRPWPRSVASTPASAS